MRGLWLISERLSALSAGIRRNRRGRPAGGLRSRLARPVGGFFRRRMRLTASLRRRVDLRVLLAFLFLLSSLALSLARGELARGLYDQRAAESWGEGSSQLSVFFPLTDLAGEDRIRELEYHVEQALAKALPEDREEGAALFVTCASAAGTVELAREGRSQPVRANAIGTAGDFFRFHPVCLLSGSYYPEDAAVPDRLLLDEDLAWQLFGSSQVAGQVVWIGGIPHTVSGVFRIPRDSSIERQAEIPENLCFLSLSSLCQLGTVTAAGSGGGNGGAGGTESGGAVDAAVGTARLYGIGAWEIVLPDPVRNFARNLVREQVKADQTEVLVVENSARFEGAALLQGWKEPFSRGMLRAPYVLPYWENLARGYGNLFSVLYLFQIVLALLGGALLCLWLRSQWKRRTWTLAGLWRDGRNALYDLQSRMKYGREKWRHF